VPAAPLSDDIYTVEVRLTDKMGNVSSLRRAMFTVDTDAPPAPQIDPVVTPTHSVHQVISGRKEAYAAILLNDTQVIAHTASIVWQHTVTLSSGSNVLNFTARDRAGNVSAPAQATILYDDVPPPPVTALTASGQGSGTTVFLNWSGYNEILHGDIQSYRIFRETAVFSTIDGLSPQATVSLGTQTYLVRDLNPGTTYWFAVVAVDRTGNFIAAVTPVPASPSDSLAPENITGLTVQSFADRLVFTWQPSANTQGDLAGYKVYFNGVAAADNLPAGQTSYERTGLSPSSAYPVKVSAYDTQNNESTGVTLTGYTWLDNPAGLTAEPYNGYVQLNWSAVAPAANLKHYAVYAQAEVFNSVEGLVPVLTVSATQSKVAGLTNNQNYFFAVTAVNRSSGERPGVTSVAAQPAPDEQGPQLTNVLIDGQPLVSGRTLTRPANITLNASDPSGVGRVEFRLNAETLSISTGAPHACVLDIAQIPDGAHAFEIAGYDTLGNVTILAYSLQVSLAVPPAPVITAPVNGFVTNSAELLVQGQAARDSLIQLFLNGQPAGAQKAVDSQGRFSLSLTLGEGTHQLQASAANRSGSGPLCSAVTVTLDTSVPQEPKYLFAQAVETGQVRLSWKAPDDAGIKTYNLYRHSATFSAPADAVKVNNNPITKTDYLDLPPGEGTWYYRVAAVNAAQNQSALSNESSTESDNTLPRAVSIEYAPQGNVDPISGAVAPGRVDLTLTVSELLMAMPFLSITPERGVPIAVTLRQVTPITYSGHFEIESITPSGTAYAIFSGRDKAGNRGTEIDSGQTLLIDASGPAVRRLDLSPATPIRNDQQAPVTVAATIGLSEPVRSGSAPELDYILSGPGRLPLAISDLVESSPQAGDAQTWQGSIQLPADAGQADVETLTFAFRAMDSLGNAGDHILAPNLFQVYQGDLPPLAAPGGLCAKSLPAGRIELAWNAVPQAVAYRLYRQGPTETELTPLARIDGPVTFSDVTDRDGQYHYAVTSIRSENGQEAESGQSAPVAVTADSESPAAPQNLALRLIPVGIEANWEYPFADKVTYRLYRSAAAEITTIEGLTPLDCDFDRHKALDRKPSPSDHSYVVTAVDEAGNESVPSNSVYLNFTLLPVATISVEQSDTDKPVLTWTHPGGGDLAGFDVFLGPAGQSLKVTPTPITQVSFTDTGFAGDSRDYAVVAVDINSAGSPARSIRLPELSAQLAPNSRLRRGIMNKLEYSVSNLSTQNLANLKVIARVGGTDHPSDTFSLAVRQSRTVPVIVAGYQSLMDAEPLVTIVQYTPEKDETARIVRTGTILAGEGMLTLQLYSEEMIRGGTGKLWFSLTNTGEAEIEIVTALNHGNKPSDEIVFTLSDPDGNVLTTINLQQALGQNVINLAGGKTVARIPAGAVFESEPVQIPVPAAAPDNVVARLSIANIYHRLGRDGQLVMRGLGSSAVANLVETPYTGAIEEITPPVTAGRQNVTITGRAVTRQSEQAVPNAPLNLILTLNGFERKIELVTDSSGNFSHTFAPPENEAGTYKVAALHPDLLERPVQATFTVTRLTIKPDRIRLNMPKNYAQTIPIEVVAGQDTTVHNLRLDFHEWDQPANAFTQGFSHQAGQVIESLGPGEKAVINLTLSSDNRAADSGALVLRLVSDESGTQPWGFVAIEAQLTSARPFLSYASHYIETGVLLGDAVTETVILENNGLADLENVSLALIGDKGAPLPAWVLLNGPAELGTLAVGMRREIPVTFAPRSNTPEGLYTFYLRVTASDYPATDIPIYVSATPSGIGNALFKIKNIYTGTLNDRNEVIQGLSGARITLQNEKNLTIVHEKASDTYGEALFANLSAGIYKYRITAAGHQEKIGRLWIKPGITASEDLYLDYNFVTVEWQVVETTIADKYEIVLKITYETDVPAPVVVCEPSSVTLPDLKAGDVLNGEFILTNYGLIRADNLEVNLPADDAYIKYELLAPVPKSLGAKERISVPYRLTCIQSLTPEPTGTGGAGGCYRSCFSTRYSGVSSNGCPYSGTAPHCFQRTCGGGGSGGGGGGWGWWSGGGGGGGGGGSGGGGPGGTAIGGSSSTCTPEPDPDIPPTCDGGGGAGSKKCPTDAEEPVCQKGGSFVNLFARTFTDNIADLAVKVPGGAIEVSRSFYNNGPPYHRDSWHFAHERTLEFDVTVLKSLHFGMEPPAGDDGTVFTLKPIKREGVTYWPDRNKPTIDTAAGEQAVLRPNRGSDQITYIGEDTWRWEDKFGNWEQYQFKISSLKGVYAKPYRKFHVYSELLARTFAKQARLIAYGDRQGVIARNLFDENDVLVGTIDRNDRQVLWFTRAPSEATPANQLLTIRDLENRKIEYELTYGTGGLGVCHSVPQLLIYSFKDSQEHETRYTYSSTARFKWSARPAQFKASTSGAVSGGSLACTPPPRLGLTSVTDALGRTKTITYDGDGAVSALLDQEGNGYRFKYAYDDKSRQYYAQVSDTSGMVKETWINAVSEATRIDVNGRTVKTFDKDGKTYTITDESGNKTVKAYDQWDNLVRVIYPDGAEVKYEYDPVLHKVTKKIDENSVTTAYHYDAAGRLVRRVEARATDLQRTTEFSYDAEGNLDTIRIPGDAQSAEVVTTMTYDSSGNMETLTDPQGQTTRFTYDAAGNVLTKTDALDKVWSYTYDGQGRLTSVRDPLSNLTEYFYDQVGNKIREVDPAGKETVFEYDVRDNLKKSINPALEESVFENTFDGRILSQSDGEKKKIAYEYDADGRMVENIDGNGNVIEFEYTGEGIGCTTCGGGDNRQPARIVFPTFTREIKYDGRGRKYAERDIYATHERINWYSYDRAGNLTARTDAEGRVTRYAYDHLNRLVSVTDPDLKVTRYAYDRRDNLIALTDAQNQTTRFEYDRNNRLVKEIRPMGQETAYAYDPVGNLIEKIDAKSQKSAYTYDAAGRLIKIDYYTPGGNHRRQERDLYLRSGRQPDRLRRWHNLSRVRLRRSLPQDRRDSRLRQLQSDQHLRLLQKRPQETVHRPGRHRPGLSLRCQQPAIRHPDHQPWPVHRQRLQLDPPGRRDPSRRGKAQLPVRSADARKQHPRNRSGRQRPVALPVRL
jgi:large repetitive protein